MRPCFGFGTPVPAPSRSCARIATGRSWRAQAAAKRDFAISRQPEVSLSRRCTRRGRCPSLVADHSEHAVDVSRRAGAALYRKPDRLVEHHHVVVVVERDEFQEGAGLVVARAGGDSASADRVAAAECGPAAPPPAAPLGSVRLPLIRNSPFRMTRWIWLNDSPGNRASKKRSTRMPVSSGVTATVCTWRMRHSHQRRR